MTSRTFAYSALAAAVLFGAVLGVPRTAYPHKPISTNILFKNEVAQIFQRKCFQCHSENNVAFSLTTYTDARPWARAIREEILDRQMPPWQAVPGFGHFANDISLTTREKEIVLSWADGGAPSGVLKVEESIPPVFVPAEPSWDHGAPDLVFAIGSAEAVPAYAPFAIRRFVVDTNLPAPTRVHALALKQGDRRVVRHAAFYEEGTGRWLGSWTPWQTTSELRGAVIELPKQARIAVEIGYAGAAEDVTDTSHLGLYVEPAAARVAEAVLLQGGATPLPAGASGQRVRVESTLAAETAVVALWPDPEEGARSIEITAIAPDGMLSPLLWIQQYRPEWRSSYLFSTPVTLTRGTRLVMTTYFDNPGGEARVVRSRAWMLTAAPAPSPTRQR